MERLSVSFSRSEIRGAISIVFGGKIINEDRSGLACLHAYAWPRRLSGFPAGCVISQPCGYVIKMRVCFAFRRTSKTSSTILDLSKHTMDGYHKLASLVGDHEELFMLRRFARTNAKNLLYMQAEILHLEAELHDIAKEDRSGCEKCRNYEYCVFDLKESFGIKGSDTQWRKILEIREMLKEYS
jgi:hypothetical protein